MISLDDNIFVLSKSFTQDFKHLSKKVKPKFEIEEDDYKVSRIFIPLVKCLQFVGYVPLRINNQGRKVTYEHKLWSFTFFFCWATLLSQLFGHVMFLLNVILEIDSPIKLYKNAADDKEAKVFGFSTMGTSDTSPITKTLLRIEILFSFILPASAFISSIMARLHFRSLQLYLNNWAVFMKEYHKTFLFFHNFELKGKKLKRIFGFFSIVVLLGFLTMLPRHMNKLAIGGTAIKLFITYFFFVSIYGASFLTMIFGASNLHAFKVAYRQIRCGIEAQYDGMSQEVTYDQVKSWIRLVSRVRSQVDLFQKFVTGSELADLAGTFITVLGISYVTFSLLINGTEGGYTLIGFAAMFTFMGFLRTFVKGVLAEKITEEEEKILMTILSLKTKDSNCRARLEMKVLCDMILTNPIKITFGNIISLNKRLVLSILQQLAAYLVVFLQFKK